MSKPPTLSQISAGGVVFRKHNGAVDVVLISVGDEERWQLPKGLLGSEETAEIVALREVREETGLEAVMVGPLDTIDYWYFGSTRGKRVRYHKYVHYYLLRYLSGDTVDHDAEVNEARWFEIDEAITHLAFKNEQDVLLQARDKIDALS